MSNGGAAFDFPPSRHAFERDMEAYDALPPLLRRLLREAPVSFSAVWCVEMLFKQYGELYVAKQIHENINFLEIKTHRKQLTERGA